MFVEITTKGAIFYYDGCKRQFHVICVGYMRNECKRFVNKPQEEDHLEDISTDGKIIRKFL